MVRRRRSVSVWPECGRVGRSELASVGPPVGRSVGPPLRPTGGPTLASSLRPTLPHSGQTETLRRLRTIVLLRDSPMEFSNYGYPVAAPPLLSVQSVEIASS